MVGERSWEGITSPASNVTLAPAVRLDPPTPVTAPVAETTTTIEPVATTVAAPVDRSTCRNDLEGAVMTLTIPDIAYTCSVYAGGQSMLNDGAVTQITDEAIRQVLADYPGGPGLLWFAGHRTTHGATFAAVPDLADGALITVTDGTSTATYRVAGRATSPSRTIGLSTRRGRATGAGDARLDHPSRPRRQRSIPAATADV